MRLKHNKKRNTAFIYEALVRELTESVAKNNRNKQNRIVSIIREHFQHDSILKEELSLYKSIYETRDLQKPLAEKIVVQVKEKHETLDKKKLFQEQSALINKINKTLSTKVYTNFVPNYKTIASVYSIFQDALPVKDRVLLEEKIVDEMSSSIEQQAPIQQPIDSLTYGTFVKKFNEEYSNILNESQKKLLGSYVSSFENNGLDFKVHLNEEIGRIKSEIGKVKKTPTFLKSEDLQEKINSAMAVMDDIKNKPIDAEVVEIVLNAQQMLEEIEDNDN
jgi:hypothetical protein